MEPIKYFLRGDCPGEYFECSRLSATLTKSSCADMWRQARKEKDNFRLHHCRNCKIGAMHAGEHEISTSRLSGKRICARCHRPSNRFISDNICVSCYNRQQEWLKGKNAKGTKPIKQRPLKPMSVPYVTGDELHIARAVLAESTNEMIIRMLRDSQKNVRFGFYRRALAIEARELVSD
ncbi:hypothetical protein [Nitrosomonas sp. Nm132]|jgi:hypothetical protein|uniref:hypothetical protein n=1 Tax=Nitrosomonas sp. Nm132 TaxID=1881053 RepID=UPI000888310E|nr:hypothetical protein [Nitrosomonas sp. Nm132]SDH26316.1 hypothetical protein SAMN05428952_100940 [Nitrosomonas sp. Nm132]